MRFTTHAKTPHFHAFLAASALACVLAGPADAGKRNPAPITYAGQGTQTSQPVAPVRQEPVRTTAPQAGQEGKRIAFRYPGQTQAAPVQDAPRQYASANAPQMSAPLEMTDPATTPGGFDARVTADRISAARQSQEVIESTSLAALTPSDELLGQGTPAVSKLGATPAAAYAVAPAATPVFDELGVSVTYGDEFAGLPTANGEVFAQDGMTAAHPTLPLPSLVQVINVDTQREVVVRVNDRGPFEDGAMLQVSKRAADVLGFDGAGRANVRVRYLGPAPVNGQSAAFAPQSAPETIVPASYSASETMPVAIQASYVTPAETKQPAYTPQQVSATGNYYVQIGSFADIGNAQALEQALGAGMPVVIVPARVNGADYFRVRVGPLENRQTADSLRDHLASQGIANGRVVTAD